MLQQSTNLNDIKYDNFWNPKLSITNWLSDPKETIWYTVIVNSMQEALICERRRVKGTFLENLELNKFPFDTQVGLQINQKMSNLQIPEYSFFHFTHSDHFNSAPSSLPLLSGAPDYSTDTVSEFHAEAHRQLQVKDLPKVPTWRLERESNQRSSG